MLYRKIIAGSLGSVRNTQIICVGGTWDLWKLQEVKPKIFIKVEGILHFNIFHMLQCFETNCSAAKGQNFPPGRDMILFPPAFLYREGHWGVLKL
jgi:hypothetical protein